MQEVQERKSPRQRKRKVDTSSNEGYFPISTAASTDECDSICSKKLKLDEERIKNEPTTIAKNQLVWCYLPFDIRVLSYIVDTKCSSPSCAAEIKLTRDIDAKT